MSPRRPFTAARAWARRLRATLTLRRAKEAGYAAVMVALIVPTVGIGCAAVAVDIGSWYARAEGVQKAADAAALGGVPFLPQDLPKATARAKEITARNGFEDGTSGVTVTVGLGEKPTQLKVTITTTMRNTFGSAIGISSTTITRSAIADYQGPAPMGSPCNTFGNEPDAGSAGQSALPTGTANGGAANCSRTPALWGTVEGPETGKVQGDRYQTKKCESSGVDGCTGTTNDEYDDFGYVFVVKVQPGAVGQPIDLQLYDPMFVDTGQDCSLLPDTSAFGTSGNANNYVTNAEARTRYVNSGSNGSPSAVGYCTGDSYPGAGSGANPRHRLTTSYILRQQTDTQNPKLAAVQTDTSGAACVKQYGSYNTSNNNIGAGVFTSSGGSYNEDVARTFHNWVSFCRFTPTHDGDYYLQVRTNVALGGATVSGGTGLITTGNTAAAQTNGDSTPTGEGANSFSIRAVPPTGLAGQVSVSGYNHMPIYMNSPSASATFYLIRVLPGAAGQKISFSYFDAGDAAGTGSVKVLPPPDATGTITTAPFPGGCDADGGSAGTGPTNYSTCEAPFTQNGSGVSRNNGKTETITIPIPSDYECNFASFQGCWYRVNVVFANGSVHDTTTWNATVIGDPVRIIK